MDPLHKQAGSALSVFLYSRQDEPGVRSLPYQAWPLYTAKNKVSTFKLYFAEWVSSMVFVSFPDKASVVWEQYRQALQVSALLEFFRGVLNAEPSAP